MFDLNKFIKEKSLVEKFIYLIGIILVWLLGWLTKNLPFSDLLIAIVGKISPLYLAISVIFLFFICAVLVLYLFQLSKKINLAKDSYEFISRHNLNWKRTGNKIYLHPYCLCCTTPFPLQEQGTHSENQECEYFRCIHPREESGHRIYGISHWAKKDRKPISYKEAYLLVCKEFKIKFS